MRPIRLEVAGFTTFRDPVTIDFEGVDYFALVGPTGSGKTSVLDAMVFSLFGSVFRYDNQNLVEPVITKGLLEARLRFTFSVGGVQYTAARVVRRMPRGGATTKEARLERAGDSEPLAGDADGVTRAVQELLGLSFDHFTRCVVLPQGEFARFLHDTPAERQTLLVKLLDLNVYKRMGQRANQFASEAGNRAHLLRDRLDNELAFATPAARELARTRAERLTVLRNRIDDVQPRLDELAVTATAQRAAADALVQRATALAGVTEPAQVASLHAAVAAAEATRMERLNAVEEAEKLVAADEADLMAFPERVVLERAVDAHARRAHVLAAAPASETTLAQARAEETERAAALIDAEDAVQVAEEAREAIRRGHLAHQLAVTLAPGRPCPVCQQKVTTVPKAGAVPALEQAEAAFQAARAERDAIVRSQRAAQKALADLEAAATARATELSSLEERVADHPDAAAVADMLSRLVTADTVLTTARAELTRAGRALKAAELDVQTATRDAESAWKAYDAARDRVAAEGPPAARRDDLVLAWHRLVEWAQLRAPELTTEAEAASAAAVEAEGQRAALVTDIEAACRECDLEVGRAPARDVVVDALARAEAEVTRIEEALARAAQVQVDLDAATKNEHVSRTLGLHLAANRFEKWMLDEALAMLVEGANGVLAELTGGQYALDVDDRANFTVIDHRNADEVRSARTLSGGETFLASLALALALADRLADLAAEGAPRLETLFLDEGFGTLDIETLQTVADTMESLKERGRMVGLVTHVRELAETVPVRFEVRKGPLTSTVEKLIA